MFRVVRALLTIVRATVHLSALDLSVVYTTQRPYSMVSYDWQFTRAVSLAPCRATRPFQLDLTHRLSTGHIHPHVREDHARV